MNKRITYSMTPEYLEGYIRDKEDDILRMYYSYCKANPEDKEVDEAWESYSFWINARQGGRVFNKNKGTTIEL